MDVSVIFATHNRDDVLERVFDAWREVDKVTEYEYEIICSDDESTDRTLEIIEGIQDLPITLIKNKKGGAAKARNAALKIARGKIVIFTGDDMFPQPDFVNKHYRNYLKFGEKVATLGRIEWHPDIEMNYLMYHITNIGCEQFGFVGLPPYQLIDFRHFYTSNISVPMSQLKALGEFFSTDFDKYGFEDIELGFRLEQNGMKIYYDPDIEITHYHVYNSVEKFCTRHETAGEELVVFHRMHPILEDRCICDISDLQRVWDIYCAEHSNSRSVEGVFLSGMLRIAKAATKILEKVIVWNKPSALTKIESMLYAGIFKLHFMYGCVNRIALGSNMPRSRRMQFAYHYLEKNFSQIYWDTGYGINETESRKWCCWDQKEVFLHKDLPQDTRSIRLSPLKKPCKMQLLNLQIETENGEKTTPPMTWHNAKKTNWVDFDFTNTNDPQIVIDNLPQGVKSIEVRMKVKEMGGDTPWFVLKRVAKRLKRRMKIAHANHKQWNIDYASGQPRKVQICIGGLTADERKKLIEEYTQKAMILGDSVIFSDITHPERDYTTYIYKPSMEPLDSTQMFQVAYMLLNSVYDYVVVSKSFEDFPMIGCKKIEDVLICSEMLARAGEYDLSKANGRYMRLPGFSVENEAINICDQLGNIKLVDDYFLTGQHNFKPKFRQSVRNFNFTKTKPLIFVDPIFLAVGGVERNTIEVMRALKDEYTFCVLTMERHSKGQGSLHFQLKGICDYIFDLREITEFENYFACLNELKQIFQPDVLWMCNNSPWFETNTSQIRKIFSGVAMIAQDVYDTREGWIEYYSNPEVKQYDRYIAITEIIKETFITKYQIEEKKIDVIYPVIDEKKIQKELDSRQDPRTIRDKYGMNQDKKLFTFAGRLTEQKNPLRYLRLVEAVKAHGKNDIHFIMVGDGVLRGKVDDYIKKAKLEEYVTCIPYIENMPEFFHMLDGLIITSVYEGMPIVSIESMCMSKPILSTDIGDLKRFINKYENGVIMNEDISDYENFVKFCDALDMYTSNAEKHSREVLDFFSAGHIADAYRSVFEKGIQQYKGKK